MAAELPPALIQQLKDALRDVADSKEVCRRGQQCGYDMREEEAQAEAVERRIQATLQQFGSGKRGQA